MTNDKWLFANLYKPRFVTCSLKPEACPGFTLVELLVIVVILGFLLSMMPRVFTEDSNQRRFDETRERMKEIKKAILGIPGSYLVEPVLNRDRQPEELWEQKGQAGKSYSSRCRRPIGWGGPYIEKPRGGVLKDGWGNPLVFKDSFTCLLEIARGNMVIVSYGSDGMPGGSGYGEDITLEIRRPQYMAQVAGQAAEDIADVKICFNSGGKAIVRKITGLSPGD
jgi:type II secretory pathway pseudopilin PulG